MDRCEVCGIGEGVLPYTLMGDRWLVSYMISLCYECYDLCEDSGRHGILGIYIPSYIPKEQYVKYITAKVVKNRTALPQNKNKSL